VDNRNNANGYDFYMLVTWEEPATMKDYILFVLAGSSSVTQIAVGALIDMHTMSYKVAKSKIKSD
jgi:hypothetical protein